MRFMLLNFISFSFHFIISIQGKYSTKLFYKLPCYKKDTFKFTIIIKVKRKLSIVI